MLSQDRFTVKAQEALAAAREDAIRRRHTEMASVHLLASLMNQEDGVAIPILQKMGTDTHSLKARVEKELSLLPQIGKGIGDVYPTIELQEIFREAISEADRLKDDYISSEHLLLALAGDGTSTGRILREAGVAGTV